MYFINQIWSKLRYLLLISFVFYKKNDGLKHNFLIVFTKKLTTLSNKAVVMKHHCRNLYLEFHKPVRPHLLMYLILTLKLESYVINNVIRFNFRLKSFTCSTICRKTGKSYFTVMSHTNCYILTRTHITCVCLHINSHAYFVDCI